VGQTVFVVIYCSRHVAAKSKTVSSDTIKLQDLYL
jgi:hypothetical protein